MKEFLLSLSRGVNPKLLSNKELDLVRFLEKLKCVELKDNLYIIAKKHFFGSVDIAMSGTGFLEAYSSEIKKDLLIEPNDLLGATKGDIVVVKRVYSGNRRAKGKVVAILKRKYQNLVVYLKKTNNRITAHNIKTDLITPINATQKSLRLLPKNTILTIDSISTNIKEVLGTIDQVGVDEKISMALFNKVEEFSYEAKKEIESYGDSVDASLYPNRVDLRDLDFVTIDPYDAKDFDDAVYFDVDRCVIYVAIADVSSYVHPYTKLDMEAKKRGFTIYFPHKSIPMLPRILSEKLCSLQPHVDRLAYTFKITLDPKTYEVKKEELFESIINSSRRFNYEEIDEILDGKKVDKEDEKLLPWIFELNKAIRVIRERRLKKGYTFATDEIKIHLDADNKSISKTTIGKQTASHELIEDCMLLANKASAKMLESGIFRVHPTVSPKSIEALLEDIMEFGIFVESIPDTHKLILNIQKKAKEMGIQEDIDKLIIRSQKQAFYSHKKDIHFGLGFKEYSHFTSPIRRYSDLMLHRLLKSLKTPKEHRYLLTNIESDCKSVSILERETDKVVRDFTDRKYARWANDNLNGIFQARIKYIKKSTIAILQSPIIGARIILQEEDLELFSLVDIKIISVDLLRGKIYGEVVARYEEEKIKIKE